jgi:monoamine oxidase
MSDLDFQSTWETSRLQPGTSGIISNYTGGQKGMDAGTGTAGKQMTAFLNEFDLVFPGAKAASNGKVVRFHWPSYPLALGSYSAYKVGQYTTFAGVESERYKNVHFAGEHTSLDAQGYMEGGALSGAIAAEEIATDLHHVTMKHVTAGEQTGLWAPRQRILGRARAARNHRRWHAQIARWKKTG